MKDLYYRAAAELTVASNSGWEYLASNNNIIKEENKDTIKDLAIFKDVLNPLFKTASFFIVLFAGWRLITKLTSNKDGNRIFDAFRATFPLLIVAIILWDFTILFSIVSLLQSIAGTLSSSISNITNNQ